MVTPLDSHRSDVEYLPTSSPTSHEKPEGKPTKNMLVVTSLKGRKGFWFPCNFYNLKKAQHNVIEQYYTIHT